MPAKKTIYEKKQIVAKAVLSLLTKKKIFNTKDLAKEMNVHEVTLFRFCSTKANALRYAFEYFMSDLCFPRNKQLLFTNVSKRFRQLPGATRLMFYHGFFNVFFDHLNLEKQQKWLLIGALKEWEENNFKQELTI